MKIVTKKITLKEIEEMAKNMFGNVVKAVIDIDKKIMVVDGELHADEEAILIKNGSEQKNLWGINIYPELKEDYIEFDSMINIRPSMNNKTRGIDDKSIKKLIIKIVESLITK